ncbi:serine hydrolase [Sphingomonas sp. ac-8]|uniref:serine hydrolase n=1 Tax=Sphingomonas sp. ac-8 TaxID=3242977 RepID=UPI003A7F9410
MTASQELRQRADTLAAAVGGGVAYAEYFAPNFRADVSEAAFRQLCAQLQTGYGKPTGIESLTPRTAHIADFRLGFERGIATGQIVVDPAAPHQVTGLLITRTEPREAAEASVEAVVAALKTLPGTTGFTLTKLDGDAPRTLAAHNATTPLAIGSAFKLVILAELVRATNAGERRWDDVVTLDGTGLPGGGYTQKPAGTRVSLRELATQMISVSDNSATDILLRHLGREKVEAMLPVIGFRDAKGRNMPFLATLEMFKLKGVQGGALGRRFEAADVAGRRALLAGPVAKAPVSAIPAALFQDRKPIRIATIEWFASPEDLVRTMDWLRRHSEGAQGAELRAILSKNPGITATAAARWGWIGYKGGSEPGVLNMTLLLQAKTGGWYALAASWNDPAAPIDEPRFAALVQKAATLAAP